MDDDLQQGVSGLFYRDTLTSAEGELGPVFCKPINIRVYSAPPPVRCRLITYELIYWSGPSQPNVVDQWNEAKRYVRPCGRRRFSFTTGTICKLLPMVLDDIRRHAHSVVFTSRPLRNAEEGLKRFFDSNTTTRTLEVDDGSARLKNIHHVVYITLDDAKNHTVSDERIHYDVESNGGKAVSGKPIPITYSDNRRLIEQTAAALRSST